MVSCCFTNQYLYEDLLTSQICVILDLGCEKLEKIKVKSSTTLWLRLWKLRQMLVPFPSILLGFYERFALPAETWSSMEVVQNTRHNESCAIYDEQTLMHSL